MVIKPEAIPQFAGNVDAIEKHAGTLKTVGGQFRDIGADTHNTWQGLSAFYDAPEADKLFAATAPIKSSADTFGGQVEWVGSALSQYASTIRPIVDKLTMLKSEASCFVGMVNADEDWQEDEAKVNRNNDLIRQVDAQVAALMAAERTAANQINKLYGGTQWTVNDGTSQSNMYGFNAGDIPADAERPWGTSAEVDEPWYVDTWNAVWSAGKGIVVDGLWGTVKGIWGLINPFDWETFKSSWGGLWTLTGNVFFDPGETGEAWKQVGKGFIAWDEWEKDPARATGLVAFNVLTLPVAWLKLGKAGQAGKLSLLDKVGDATKLSKIGELANAGKLAGILKLDKIHLPTVGDLAKQIDGTFKDILARDPGLDAALRNADNLAARTDTPTIRGDDIIGRTDEVANARRPALVGAGAAHADDLTSAGRVGDDLGDTGRHGDDLDSTDSGSDYTADDGGANPHADGEHPTADDHGGLAEDGVPRLTGAEVRRPRNDLDFELKWADDAYDAIRATDDDVSAIAATAHARGFTPDDIKQIKDHVFRDEHILDSYPPATVGRFDANPRMAEAWLRLTRGEPHPSDFDLLSHERFEANFMAKTGDRSYSRAHAAALDAGHTWDPEAAAADGLGHQYGR